MLAIEVTRQCLLPSFNLLHESCFQICIRHCNGTEFSVRRFRNGNSIRIPCYQYKRTQVPEANDTGMYTVSRDSLSAKSDFKKAVHSGYIGAFHDTFYVACRKKEIAENTP